MLKPCTIVSLLLALLLVSGGCSGEDPIKAKRIAIENGTYDPGNNNGNNNGGSNNENNGNNNGGKEPEDELYANMTKQTVSYSFDLWEKNPSAVFYLPVEAGETDKDPEERFWASASNLGAAMAMVSKAEDYPVHYTDDGRTGRALRLTTIKGVPLFGSGLITGSLYSGRLNAKVLVTKPLESTMFGQPVSAIPLSMQGYYRWAPGEELVNGKLKPVEGVDQATISCVFYDVTDDDSYLNGSTLYTDSRILARAVLHPEATPDDRWRPFSMKVEAVDRARYKKIDLKQGKYRMAIVFSSSARGDEFIGAIGSCLMIDDVQLTLGTPR